MTTFLDVKNFKKRIANEMKVQILWLKTMKVLP